MANKILRRRLGSNNFVADFPTNMEAPLMDIQSIFKQKKDTQNYKVFVSTWNVGGIAPHDDLDMVDWLDTCNSSCDIYVLGFQEIVPLRAGNVLGPENNKIRKKWNSLTGEALNNKKCSSDKIQCDKSKETNEFQCIISKQMVGIFLSVWVRNDLVPFIRNTSVSYIGCGIMGCLGNKGSVSVRFMLHETSLCFVCTHLASGGRKGDERFRNSNAMEILSKTHFSRGDSLGLPQKIMDHDRVILLGDLNYRISLPEETTRLLLSKEEWNTLLENDQLRMELMNGKVFQGWHEGTIKFAPTYKYYSNSDVYYGSVQPKKCEKRRAPAWCDRVIWFGEGLKQCSYTRGESKLSDHRPVKAIFRVEIGV